ncbi:MazG nucleotide pyrophosphohydrolase domain-containing protein [Nocardioides sp.]|uniref:MazG nucleotide pyrophosphohydrolase domain-containing protein n=1 Tax=Nocardioides sp. TaxID=35761 RepID=UPI002C60C1EF|nr:MazG nucleotide pyrophosphohydrolase domain-containing protein [Nocardioides sp.]HSX66498.1 MazG nucleotide pyrophosphohydrolase domain-containing protein [Nocardioides sp.]
MSAGGEGLVEFLGLMRTMRERCAWKGAQTHASLAPYLREEADEVLEAISDVESVGDAASLRHLCDELGDLLLQIYFHAAIAEEAGAFTMDDVVGGLTAKMRRRNPHVFGPEAESGRTFTLEEIEEMWQAAKAAERSDVRAPEEL